jgi:hypothetical protein
MLVGGIVLLPMALARPEPLWAGRRALGFVVAASALFTADLAFWHRSIHLVGPGLATIYLGTVRRVDGSDGRG